MELIRYTLLADGSSDSVLLPIISWLIAEHRPGASVMSAFARDMGNVGRSLAQRIPVALANFPCDILVIHRDAERESLELRLEEIADATRGVAVPVVPLVPVRMTEAWLFADESAIRFAAGNLSHRVRLELPKKKSWESLPDPKATLIETLKTATGKSGRALSKFHPEQARALISPRSEHFRELRGIPSFDAFEAALVQQLIGLTRNAMD